MVASAQGIRGGRAFVELFADDSKLVRGLNQAKARLQQWGSAVRAVGTKIFAAGAGVGGGLIAATKMFSVAGDQLQKMSARTGVAVEALSEIGYAAGQSGSSLEAFEKGVRKMQQNMTDAADGSQTARDAFAKLGLSVEELAGLSPDQQFAAIADRIAEIQDPALRTALAMDVFGKSGAELLPLMQNGAKGIDELRQRARQLGLVMSTDDANAAAAFGDALDDLWSAAKGIVNTIGAALAPSLTRLALQLAEGVAAVGKWISKNRGLVVGVAMGAAAFAALGTAIVGIGAALSAVGTVLGAIGSAVVLVGTVLGALLSPIGLVTAAVVGLGAYFASTTGLIDAAAQQVKSVFSGIADEATAAFRAIAAALGAGDIGAAANVLWAELRLLWTQGVNWINGLWMEGRDFFLDMWSAAAFKISDTISGAFLDVQSAWVKIVGVMEDTWAYLTGTSLKNLWRDYVGFVVDSWVGVVTKILDVLGIATDRIRDVAEDVKNIIGGPGEETDPEQERQKKERETSRNDRLQGISKERAAMKKANEDALEEQLMLRALARKDAKERGVQEAQEALQEAKRARDAAFAAAEEARSKSKVTRKGENGEEEDLSKKKPLPEVKKSITGTFNAFALAGLGGAGAPLQEVAKNTKLGNQHLARMNKSMEYIANHRAGFNWGD